MEHHCVQDDKLRAMEIKIAVVENNVDQVKADIKDMRNDIKWAIRLAITTLLGIVIEIALQVMK